MKKIKIFSILLFLLSTAAFAGFRIYEGMAADRTAPVITADSDTVQMSVADDESKLLEGVTAEDSRDGDVTDTLVIQSLTPFIEGTRRTVNYAAVDGSGNVGYFSRTLEYTDYQAPVFAMSSPLRFPLGSTINICEGLTASSTLDGDLTNGIKYTLDGTISNAAAGTYPVEFRVTDSAGRTSYLTTEIEVYDPSTERIEVSLSTYLVYLRVNDPFDPAAYYAGADEEGALNIQSNVNTAQAGSYFADYYVTSGTQTGKTRLIVVVSE